MTTQVPEWQLLIILFGVALVCLGQLCGFITVQQEIPRQRLELEKQMEYYYSCGNGMKKCLPSYHPVTLVRNDSDFGKETLSKRKKRVSKKVKKRKKGTEQDKPASNEGTKDVVNNVIKIPNKEFIAWNLHPDTQLYMFDMKKPNDPDISGFKNVNSIQDVKRKTGINSHRNSGINRRTIASLKVPPRDASSPPSAQENDGAYHWTNVQLFHVVLYCFICFIFGFILRPHFSSLKYSICNYFISLSQRRKNLRRQRETTKFEVDSNLNLADLPFNVEEFFVKKLDVRCPGQRFYGWQKVGEAFNIDKDDLRYLKIEYKRDNGSPTSKLFEMLGKTQNKKVSDLVEVLKRPEVRRSDIVSVINLLN